MNIESISSVSASAAGAPLAQGSGASVERAAHVTAARRSQLDSARRADGAAGISETDAADIKTDDREADGRQPWQPPSARSPEQKAIPSNGPAGDDLPGRGLDLTA
jgi:hypothetical protein